MARRKNNRTNESQSTIFDIPGIDDTLPAGSPIADFVVHGRGHSVAESDVDDPLDMALDESAMPHTEPLLFMSFGSGSSGNCAYIGTRFRGLLIDAGVDPTTVREGLEANGLSIDNVEGICLTHDHSDHVRYVYQLVRRKSTGIYCTPKTLNGLLRRHSISRRIKDYHHPVYKEFAFDLAGMKLTAFDVSHDGTDNCGYFIEAAEHRFAVATDLGCITDRVDHYMRCANHIMIESNYDATMLRNGPYPQYLKARIAAERGHLDNEEAAAFLGRIVSTGLRNIFLCHLSQDNNTPDTALACVREGLHSAGIAAIGACDGSLESRRATLQLCALPRFGTSQLFVLRDD